MDNGLFADWLQALDLARVTITATIDSCGRLGAVGGLWPKLLAAAKESATLGLVRVVVVAAEQPDVPQELEQDDASPFRILRAATIQAALGKLYEEHGPRDAVRRHERLQCATLDILGNSTSIETHYQVLPLLRAVKREQLPKAKTRPAGERELRGIGEEELGGLRGVDILGWEEELQAAPVTYELVSIADVFQHFRAVTKETNSDVPRFVVLGPPGSGKTTLTQYIGWQATQGNLEVAGRALLPARIRLREWETWAARAGNQAHSVQAYLAAYYADLACAPRATQWSQWLQRGEVLLLLDGLDEIEGKAALLAALKTALLTFKECPTVLTCRTVSFEQYQALCPHFPLFTLAGMDTAARDAYIWAFPAERRDTYDPAILIDHLNRAPDLRALAANPQLLSIVCYVVDNLQGNSFPATRSELYRRALEKLFTHRSHRVEIRYPGEKLGADEKQAVVERTAFNLFVQGGRKLTFTGPELGQALKHALHAEGYGEAPAQWANALRADLIHNSGILRGSTEHGFFFLHLTVQEFLVAAFLARMVDQKGWNVQIEIAGRSVTLRHFVDRKAWDPRWQEVLTFLTGQLKDPVPLLRLFTTGSRDDLFSSRLALAALCLSEARLALTGRQSTLVDSITTNAFSCWLRHEKNNTDAAVPHLTRTLPALGQVNGRIRGTPLLEWLCRRLGDTTAAVRLGAAEALGHIGEIAAQHPEVLSALVATLHDSDVLVRSEATTALRRVGAVATQHPAVLPALTEVASGDPNWFVRSGAVRALEQMGATAAQQLAALRIQGAPLSDETRCEWSVAATPEQQPATTTVRSSESLLPFVQALRDTKKEVRRKAVRALGQMGATVTQHSEVIPALVQALYDGDEGVRSEVAEAFARMGEVAVQHPDVLPALVQVALHDQDGGVRAQATEAIGRMRAAVAQSPQTLSALVAVLSNKDARVRAQAAKALGHIGKAAAIQHPQVLTVLVAALRDEDHSVRFRAAEALGRMMAQGLRVFRRWWGKVELRDVEELAALMRFDKRNR